MWAAMIKSFSHRFVVIDGLAGVRDAEVVDMLVEIWSIDKFSDTVINASVGVLLGVGADMLSDVEITLVVAPAIDL